MFTTITTTYLMLDHSEVQAVSWRNLLQPLSWVIKVLWQRHYLPRASFRFSASLCLSASLPTAPHLQFILTKSKQTLQIFMRLILVWLAFMRNFVTNVSMYRLNWQLWAQPVWRRNQTCAMRLYSWIHVLIKEMFVCPVYPFICA